MKTTTTMKIVLLASLLFYCSTPASGAIGSTITYVVYILQKNNNDTVWHPVEDCEASGADFGEELPSGVDMTGCGYATEPFDACNPSPFEPAVSDGDRPMNSSCRAGTDLFALIPRGNCSFAKKAKIAQDSRFTAVIIINTEGQSLFTMADDGVFGKDVEVPVFMVSFSCGQDLLYAQSKGYILMVRAMYQYDIIKYLIPFVAVVGFCFLIMLFAMIVKLVRDRRKQARRRLSRRNLRKLPIKKYKKGEEPETCPICLDDFDDGDKLRILPCKHAYHCKCVDPWLTKNRKVCPVCKRKVLPTAGDSSDSEHEDREAGTSAASASPSGHERAPLLGEAPLAVGNSTFYAQYQSTDEPQTLSPPSSPELSDSSPSTITTAGSSRVQGRRGRTRVVVPGFIRTIGSGESTERLVVPVPADDAEGIENYAYTQDESAESADTGIVDSGSGKAATKRTRHPAAMGAVTRLSLEDSTSEDDDDEEDKLGAEPQTVVPTSELRGLKASKPTSSLAAARKKRREKHAGPAGVGRNRKVTPVSAPASLPSEIAIVEDSQFRSRARDDSIQLDEDQPPTDARKDFIV